MSARAPSLPLVLGMLVLVAAACAKPPSVDHALETNFPDEKAFREQGVSDFMSNRCGTLDCHGNPARPLTIYGVNGLRFEPDPNGGPRDTRATTEREKHANYNSVVGLEPEDISDAVTSGGYDLDFMLFLKPLDISGGGVRHKGGQVLRASENDPGWVCMTSWVSGTTDAQACKDATFEFR